MKKTNKTTATTASTLRFFTHMVLIMLVFSVAARIPVLLQLIIAIPRYMIKEDMGYIWFINMAIATAIGWGTSKLISKEKKWLRVLTALISGLLVVILLECIWHPTETWQKLASGISWDEIVTAAVTTIAAVLAFIICKRHNTAAANTPEKASKFKFKAFKANPKPAAAPVEEQVTDDVDVDEIHRALFD